MVLRLDYYPFQPQYSVEYVFVVNRIRSSVRLGRIHLRRIAWWVIYVLVSSCDNNLSEVQLLLRNRLIICILLYSSKVSIRIADTTRLFR